MAYTNENYLKRVIEVQDIVLKYKKRGSNQRWIYNNHVKSKFLISESTFNNYLAINAKQALQEMMAKAS